MNKMCLLKCYEKLVYYISNFQISRYIGDLRRALAFSATEAELSWKRGAIGNKVTKNILILKSSFHNGRTFIS